MNLCTHIVCNDLHGQQLASQTAVHVSKYTSPDCTNVVVIKSRVYIGLFTDLAPVWFLITCMLYAKAECK